FFVCFLKFYLDKKFVLYYSSARKQEGDGFMNIVIYNEYRHERTEPACAEVYPNGIHAVLADFLKKGIDCNIKTFCIDDVNEKMTDEVLNDTDVILWWGHMAHNEVTDETAKRVADHVNKGMGAIFLHSGHHSKPFRLLMGTAPNLSWTHNGFKEIIWTIDTTHPVAQGIPPYFELPMEEVYGEPFDIPAPDALVFIGWYSSGHVFRSGCAFKRGRGKIFYFQPGHETYPTYKNETVQKVILNAVNWVNPAIEKGQVNSGIDVEPIIK
ncbi:MAG: ThuA domain-containing protein, partial [Oscillospiraceae bacterium]|nr:ThuA domain-containing protein [Oscillospiraceae bacterium]